MRPTFITLAALLALSTPAFAQMSEANLIARLGQADTNHDGLITRDEFLAFRAKQFDRLDRNHDGFLTSDERPRMAGFGGGGNTAGMIEKFDANKDGKVDRNEFVNGPTPIFDRVDTNRDGVLSADERAAAESAAH